MLKRGRNWAGTGVGKGEKNGLGQKGWGPSGRDRGAGAGIPP